MLHLEDALRSVLVSERNIIKAVLAQVAIYLLKMTYRLYHLFPLIVPCGELCYEHPGHGCSETLLLVHITLVVGERVGLELRHKRSDSLEVVYECGTGCISIHTSQLRHLKKSGSVLDIFHIERNITEEACQMPVIQGSETLRLTEELVLFRF